MFEENLSNLIVIQRLGKNKSNESVQLKELIEACVLGSFMFARGSINISCSI